MEDGVTISQLCSWYIGVPWTGLAAIRGLQISPRGSQVLRTFEGPLLYHPQ
jgi:hypothetical protein